MPINVEYSALGNQYPNTSVWEWVCVGDGRHSVSDEMMRMSAIGDNSLSYYISHLPATTSLEWQAKCIVEYSTPLPSSVNFLSVITKKGGVSFYMRGTSVFGKIADSSTPGEVEVISGLSNGDILEITLTKTSASNDCVIDITNLSTGQVINITWTLILNDQAEERIIFGAVGKTDNKTINYRSASFTDTIISAAPEAFYLSYDATNGVYPDAIGFQKYYKGSYSSIIQNNSLILSASDDSSIRYYKATSSFSTPEKKGFYFQKYVYYGVGEYVYQINRFGYSFSLKNGQYIVGTEVLLSGISPQDELTLMIWWDIDKSPDAASGKVYLKQILRNERTGQVSTEKVIPSANLSAAKFCYSGIVAYSNSQIGIKSFKFDAQTATLPAPPTNITSIVVGGKVKLSWSASVPGVYSPVGYNIYRATSADGKNWNKIGTTTNTEFIDNSAPPGETCYYSITAVDAQGNENIESTNTGGILVIPKGITDLTSALTGSPTPETLLKIKLSWTSEGGEQYDIRYSFNSWSSWDTAIQLTGEPLPSIPGSIESWVIPGWEYAKTVYFAIKYQKNGVMSEISNITSIYTGDTPAIPPELPSTVGTPFKYFLFGDNLVYIPSANGYLRLIYFGLPDRVTSETSNLTIPDQLFESLVQFILGQVHPHITERQVAMAIYRDSIENFSFGQSQELLPLWQIGGGY